MIPSIELIDMKTITYKKGFAYATEDLFSRFVRFAPDEDIVCEFGEFRSNGWIILYPKYLSDGASGAIDTKSLARAWFVHDFLYQLMRLGLLPRSFRKKADKEFYKLCKEDDVYWWRAKYMLYVIRKVAKSATSEKNIKKVISAP